MTSVVVRWPALLAATGQVLPWGPLAAAGGGALALTVLPLVLPPQGEGLLLVVAVLVLASGCAVAGEDPPTPGAEVTPVPVRLRLLARLLLVVPVSAVALAAVAAVAALTGAAPGHGLVPLWVSLSAVAIAVGVAAEHSAPDVPGMVAAVATLAGGLVLVHTLPASVLAPAAWDSTPERVGWALGASVGLALWSTRDRAGARRPLRSGQVR